MVKSDGKSADENEGTICNLTQPYVAQIAKGGMGWPDGKGGLPVVFAGLGIRRLLWQIVVTFNERIEV